MKILLVDDEKDLISTLAQRLSFRKIDADWVTSGEEALKMIENENYDIAVLDLKMPGISGEELGQIINETHPEIQILFCTGMGKEANSESSMDNYLFKPLDIEVLIEKMNQIIKKGQS